MATASVNDDDDDDDDDGVHCSSSLCNHKYYSACLCLRVRVRVEFLSGCNSIGADGRSVGRSDVVEFGRHFPHRRRRRRRRAYEAVSRSGVSTSGYELAPLRRRATKFKSSIRLRIFKKRWPLRRRKRDAKRFVDPIYTVDEYLGRDFEFAETLKPKRVSPVAISASASIYTCVHILTRRV